MTTHPLTLPAPVLRPSRPSVLFGRCYSWVFAGGRWFLVADPAAQARADRLAAARSRLVESFERSLTAAAARS